jgi:hypothetical protein
VNVHIHFLCLDDIDWAMTVWRYYLRRRAQNMAVLNHWGECVFAVINPVLNDWNVNVAILTVENSYNAPHENNHFVLIFYTSLAFYTAGYINGKGTHPPTSIANVLRS